MPFGGKLSLSPGSSFLQQKKKIKLKNKGFSTNYMKVGNLLFSIYGKVKRPDHVQGMYHCYSDQKYQGN